MQVFDKEGNYMQYKFMSNKSTVWQKNSTLLFLE